ncbi:type III-A CRISPR-associated RAMP protein Csm3 [Thermochromatium tepidum]|jgi:CRISPR-associated protein, Csm3 family|uniref:CRISPR system Cms endoribonuclease Csm3 n=1 Tax=Thermochromatium tepidum ATCC 43061 TaxID=316276 RepID=A0A6I6DXW2_THETI|nr:type III-A CRISPR-associated RAMP protein Csm3 [Thermochromatium tepidum]QGU32421.1 type III-A CRISPR-associated RAMP protein Csm3 [Thermochromatium tepidum ATCC 43061]
MQLTQIQKLTGQIELISGLHIGGSSTEMHIGGTDNPVVKNPVTSEPYIPGSSLKGKMRSLLEWRAGLVGITDGKPVGFRDVAKPELSSAQQHAAKVILKLFGGAPEGDPDLELVREIGPTRLAFWDCNLDPAWVAEMRDHNLLLTEHKTENMIDRIRGVAEHPRNTERVPAGARFNFQLTLRVHDGEDLLDELLVGLKLLELTGLGGSGSRGYGKIRFKGLTLGQDNLQARLDQLRLD